jgi:Ion channel
VSISIWRHRKDVETLRDVALTAMLTVQCLALFVAAPFRALGHPTMRAVADLLLVAYLLLALMVSHDRVTRVVTVTVSGCGLVVGAVNLVLTSTLTSVLAHSASIIAFVVLGYVVARAVFAPGPVNTHRILGAIVLYLNLALSFSTIYRLIWDIAPDAFTGLSDGAEGPRGFAALVYFSLVTLTSTGYGDVLPINPFARSLANVESVIGQLYPATLLARLVTQHLERDRRQ